MKKILMVAAMLTAMSSSVFATTEKCIVEIEQKYCVQLSWVKGPYIDAYGSNIVTVKDLKTKKLTDLRGGFNFKTWMIMDIHQHGGSRVVTTQTDVGSYLSKDIYYFSGMDGIWQFRLVYNGKEYVLSETIL